MLIYLEIACHFYINLASQESRTSISCLDLFNGQLNSWLETRFFRIAKPLVNRGLVDIVQSSCLGHENLNSLYSNLSEPRHAVHLSR
jgi:hypothetical protein